MLKFPWHFYLVSCSQEGMLEFDGPLRPNSSRHLTVSHTDNGVREEEDRYVIDRICKTK